jgi:hypothetical protein
MTFKLPKPNSNEFFLTLVISFLMLITRAHHVTTVYALPDASLALFLIGGIYLNSIRFFIALFLLALFIDFGASALDPKLAFCLTKHTIPFVGDVIAASLAAGFKKLLIPALALTTSANVTVVAKVCVPVHG